MNLCGLTENQIERSHEQRHQWHIERGILQ